MSTQHPTPEVMPDGRTMPDDIPDEIPLPPVPDWLPAAGDLVNNCRNPSYFATVVLRSYIWWHDLDYEYCEWYIDILEPNGELNCAEVADYGPTNVELSPDQKMILARMAAVNEILVARDQAGLSETRKPAPGPPTKERNSWLPIDLTDALNGIVAPSRTHPDYLYLEEDAD